ncbi:MAG: ATP-binding cassette domain-containing protein, partial [Devosia sp.]
MTNTPVALGATASSGAEDAFLRLSGISKSYPGVLALSDFSMEVRPGEVIGLVGENGAGKSTLMKILGGIIAPDAGLIELDGTSHSALSIAGSMRAGIAFVHQELNLFENLDSASNVFIGREPRKWGPFNIIDSARLRADVQPYLDQLGATF